MMLKAFELLVLAVAVLGVVALYRRGRRRKEPGALERSSDADLPRGPL